MDIYSTRRIKAGKINYSNNTTTRPIYIVREVRQDRKKEQNNAKQNNNKRKRDIRQHMANKTELETRNKPYSVISLVKVVDRSEPCTIKIMLLSTTCLIRIYAGLHNQHA